MILMQQKLITEKKSAEKVDIIVAMNNAIKELESEIDSRCVWKCAGFSWMERDGIMMINNYGVDPEEYMSKQYKYRDDSKLRVLHQKLPNGDIMTNVINHNYTKYGMIEVRLMERNGYYLICYKLLNEFRNMCF